jgi:hypothetical protein
MSVFENRSAAYLNVREQRQRKKLVFAACRSRNLNRT